MWNWNSLLKFMYSKLIFLSDKKEKNFFFSEMDIPRTRAIFLIPDDEPQKTFDDKHLPSLPLPDLNHTLTRYLDSIKPFVTAEEYAKTEQLVKSFEQGIGQQLHKKLKKKAETEKNWIEKWWENIAYLQVRQPLLPYCSMDGVLPKNMFNWSYGSEADQIKHASLYSYFLTMFWKVLREEKYRPNQTVDQKTPFCMNQFRRLFNTVRVPEEFQDSLECYFKTESEGPCPANIIIICRGRLFCFDAVDKKGNLITLTDWLEIVKNIKKICNDSNDGAAIALLTCDERTQWSKNRKHLESLSKKNKEILQLIEKSIFVLALGDECPETDSDVTYCNVSGDYRNRWCDKSFILTFFRNGRSGSVNDHTGFDGVAGIASQMFVLSAMEETLDEWSAIVHKAGKTNVKCQELIFDIDDTITQELSRVEKETLKNRKDILPTRVMFEDYGKDEIKRLRYHPDTYTQMCLQLAYIALHGKPASCYETATTRKFYKGRTETLRACTLECVEWANSMLNPNVTNEEKKRLLDKATKRHDKLMQEARENAGCDRHLMGLYCIAMEENIPVPEIFMDPSYIKSGGGGNFILSTSCSGYTIAGGGVAPMCVNGYGVFYNIMPNKINFYISVNNNSIETDATRYFNSLRNAFRITRQMLLSESQKLSKI